MSDIVAWTRVERDDPEYIAGAEAESLFWQNQNVGVLDTTDKHGGDGVLDRYTNERLTGDPETPWYGTIARGGDFRRGLLLGTSGLAQDAHILQTNPNLHATICDISAGSLDRWQRVLGAKFPGRVETRTADLNFAEFDENAFDLVVSSSTLHHVVNLEHVAAQINRALTKDGRFFMQDYVGESFFRFGEEKKRIFEDLYNRDIARTKGRKPGLIWTNEDRGRSSPFCGIRSADILNVLGSHLRELDRHTAKAIMGLILFAQPADGLTPSKLDRAKRYAAVRLRGAVSGLGSSKHNNFLSKQYLEELRFVDSVLTDAGVLRPFDAFAVYGKR